MSFKPGDIAIVLEDEEGFFYSKPANHYVKIVEIADHDSDTSEIWYNVLPLVEDHLSESGKKYIRDHEYLDFMEHELELSRSHRLDLI